MYNPLLDTFLMSADCGVYQSRRPTLYFTNCRHETNQYPGKTVRSAAL